MAEAQVQKILEEMRRNSAHRDEALAWQAHVDANPQKAYAELERASLEDFALLTDTLEAARQFQAGQGFVATQKRHVGAWWQRDVQKPLTRASSRPFTGASWGRFGKGVALGFPEEASLRAMDIQPGLERIVGQPEGIIWGQHEGTPAWQRLPLPVQTQLVAEGHEPGELVYPPTDWRLDEAQVGRNVGRALGMGLGWPAAGAAGRYVAGGLLGRIAPKAAPWLKGLAGIGGEAAPFVAGETVHGWQAGATPQEMWTRGGLTLGTFLVVEKVIGHGIPLLSRGAQAAGKPVAGASRGAWESIIRWAQSHPDATSAEVMAAGQRAVRTELDKAPSAISGLLKRQYQEAMQGVTIREVRPIRPQMFNERVNPARVRQHLEFEALDASQAAHPRPRQLPAVFAGPEVPEFLHPGAIISREGGGMVVRGIPKAAAEGTVPRRVSKAVGYKDAVKEPLRQPGKVPAPEPLPPPTPAEIDAAVAEAREELVESMTSAFGAGKTGNRRKQVEEIAGKYADEELLRMTEHPILQRMPKKATPELALPAEAPAPAPRPVPEAAPAPAGPPMQTTITGGVEAAPPVPKPAPPPKPPPKQGGLFPGQAGKIQDEAQLVWDGAEVTDLYGNPVGKPDPVRVDPVPTRTSGPAEFKQGTTVRVPVEQVKMSEAVQPRHGVFRQERVDDIVATWNPDALRPGVAVRVGPDAAKYGPGIQPGELVVVVGHHRTAAVRQRGLADVEMQIIEGATFEQARDLAFDDQTIMQALLPTELGETFANRIGRGQTAEDMAARIPGMKPVDVERHTELLHLPESLRGEVDTGGITWEVGAALGQVSREKGGVDAATMQWLADNLKMRDIRSWSTAYDFADKFAEAAQKAEQMNLMPEFTGATIRYTEKLVELKELRAARSAARGAQRAAKKGIKGITVDEKVLEASIKRVNGQVKKAERDLLEVKLKPATPRPKKPLRRAGAKPGAIRLPDWNLNPLGFRVSYTDKFIPGVKRNILKANAAGRRINALWLSAVDSSLRGTPVREAGEKIADAFQEVTLNTGIHGSIAKAEMEESMARLGQHGQQRVWRSLGGRPAKHALSKQEQMAADAIRKQVDKAILEAASNGAAPMRAIREWMGPAGELPEGISPLLPGTDVPQGIIIAPTPKGAKDTGIRLDRQAYTRTLPDGQVEFTVSVKDLRASDEIAVVLADGTRTTAPRDALALPMLDDWLPEYIDPSKVAGHEKELANYLVRSGQVPDEDIAAEIVAEWAEASRPVRPIVEPSRAPKGRVERLAEFHEHRSLRVPEKYRLPPRDEYLRGMSREWNNSMRVKYLGVDGARYKDWMDTAYLSDEAVEEGFRRGLGATRGEVKKALTNQHNDMAGALERQVDRWDQTGDSYFWGGLRNIHATLNLHSVAAANIPQISHAALVTTNRAFAAGARDFVTKASKRDVARCGALYYQGWLEMLGVGEGTWARKIVSNWYGLGPMERGLRTVSGLAGKYHAEDMAAAILADNTNAAVRNELKGLGLSADAIIKAGKLTTPMRWRAMQVVANKTQYLGRPVDLPILYSTEWGRTLFQYKTFMYQNHRMLVQHFGSAEGKTPAQKLRMAALLATVYPAVGHFSERLKNVIAGRPGRGDIRDQYIDGAAASAAGGIPLELYQDATRWGGGTDLIRAPVLDTLRNVEEIAGYGIRRANERVFGQEPMSPGLRRYEGTKAKRAALRLGGLPGQRAARLLHPPSNIADESWKRQLSNTLRSNVPFEAAYWLGKGEVMGEPIALTDMGETRRKWGNMSASQRMTTFRRLDPHQKVRFLSQLGAEDAYRAIKRYWREPDQRKAEAQLSDPEKEQLIRAFERAEQGYEAARLERLMKRRSGANSIQPAAP